MLTYDEMRTIGAMYKRKARAAREAGKLASARLFELYSRRAYRGTLGVAK